VLHRGSRGQTGLARAFAVQSGCGLSGSCTGSFAAPISPSCHNRAEKHRNHRQRADKENDQSRPAEPSALDFDCRLEDTTTSCVKGFLWGTNVSTFRSTGRGEVLTDLVTDRGAWRAGTLALARIFVRLNRMVDSTRTICCCAYLPFFTVGFRCHRFSFFRAFLFRFALCTGGLYCPAGTEE
jgi:hypothetical protein